MQLKRRPDSFFDKPQAKSRGFARRVYAVVKKIPKGKTMTYGQVAAKAGKPGAARAVGTIMSKNYDPRVPCHRVVRADGRMGGYNRGGAAAKRKLLKSEGARW